MKFKSRHILLILLLLAATFVRLYRLPATLTFLEDEGRDLLMAKRMLDTGRPVLLGPQTSTGNMYLGPLYYYFITPALSASGMDPLGPAVLIALSGVLTVYLLYRFGTTWFGRSAGYLSALMYALLPLPILFTRNSWNPNLVPLIALLTAWAVVKLASPESRLRHYLYLGFLFGILIQLHYMAILFIAAAGLVVAITDRHEWQTLVKGMLLTLAGFILVLSPFLLFELRNDFVNSQALLRFVTGTDGRAIRYSLPLWLLRDKFTLVSTKLLSGLFGRAAQRVDPFAAVITSLAGLSYAVGVWQAWRSRAGTSSRVYLILAALFILPLISLVIYQENIHLHYLGFFFPLAYLLLGGLSQVKQLRLPLFLLVAASLIYSLPMTSGYLRSGSTNQVVRAKEVAQYIAAKSGGEPYNVVSTRDYFTSPFQYFLSLENHRPSNDLASQIFVICEGAECTKEEETTVLLFLTGPSHPSLGSYLGHPQLNSFDLPRRMVSNEHVSHGLWVAKLTIEMSEKD